MVNRKEFEELIQRYESITLEQINDVWVDNQIRSDAANKLTGFGGSNCTLCLSVNKVCRDCVWSTGQRDDFISCISNTNRNIGDSYLNIQYPKTPENILSAFKVRAKVMRNHIKKIK